jgi:hypothetical protein
MQPLSQRRDGYLKEAVEGLCTNYLDGGAPLPVPSIPTLGLIPKDNRSFTKTSGPACPLPDLSLSDNRGSPIDAYPSLAAGLLPHDGITPIFPPSINPLQRRLWWLGV